jgi:signal transduction histidine kinase
MNLLIVDDYPANRRLLRASLEAEGHGVVEAANGVEALEALAAESVDAVISDILMPGMDGFRFCREVRKSRTLNCAIPIILYTATYSSPSDRQLAETVGADAYILKPAPTAKILAAVREAQQNAAARSIPAIPRSDENYVLEQYSAALVRKLERRNSELQEAFASLQTAHEHILQLNQTLEQRVAQRTAGLDAVNKELEAFSFSVSHDLRAPLRHIAGFADLLEQNAGATLDAENRGFLTHILGATKQMNGLIDALLDLARTSRTELNLVEVDLETVLDEALAAVHADTRGRNIQWQRSRLPLVRADAVLVRQVLINLLSNAIKYSRGRDPAIIEIGTRRGRAEEAVIFVRDNGVGFDVRQASELFGAFRRLHRADEFEGIGIGLANAHRIVTRHGGSIWAEAAVGAGATFLFSLTRAQPAWPRNEALLREQVVDHGQNTGRR